MKRRANLTTSTLAACLAMLAMGTATAQMAPAPAGPTSPLPNVAPPRPAAFAEESVASGKVVSVDPQTKAIIVQGEGGNVVELVGGDEAKNFGNVNPGDIVTIRREAAVVAGLEPLGTKDVAMIEQTERVARAPAGGKPGVAREVTTTITAQVTRVDVSQRLLTFSGPRESVRTVKVADPSIDLTAVRPGQMAKIVVREIVVITVEAPKAG